MHYGLYLPNQAAFADPGVLAALAQEAEGRGWDGFFIWDEMTPVYDYAMGRPKTPEDGDVDWLAAADPMVSLTAVAAATEDIRFGSLVSPVARLQPEVFAHQTTTLDRFSGGRLVVGVGLGNPDTQFTAFGYDADPKRRAARVDEFLELLVELWRGRTTDFRGDHYTARGIALPQPLQAPRIPIWIGADSSNRAPRRRAARWDGFVPASHRWPNEAITPAEYEAIGAELEGLRTVDDPFDLVVIGSVQAGWPSTADLGAYAAAGVTWALVQALTVDDAMARIRQGPPPQPQ